MAYVFAHMFGNLKLYFGAEDYNHYSEFLRELLLACPRTWTLWLLRIGLIVAFVFHIHRRQPHAHEPAGPRRGRYVSRGTGRPPTPPAARCAGPAW